MFTNVKTAILPISSKGAYVVQTSNDNVCWTNSADYIVLLDPVVVKKAFDMVTYPNPTSGPFNIQVKFDKNVTAIVNITIADQLGSVKYTGKKIIFSDRSIRVPLNISLTKGTYSVKMEINGEINTQQLIVQ